MSDQIRQQLQQAYEFIKAGQREQAGAILVAVLRQDRDNADAWWLLANASNDPDKARQALENVLRVRPDDVRAREKLDKLVGTTPQPPPSAHFSMPISPTSSATDAFGATTNEDPFAAFPTPSWSGEPALKSDDMPMVSPFGDFDLDNLDPSADNPFPEEPIGMPPKLTSETVISRPGARTVNTTAPSDPFGNLNYGGDPFADVGALRPSLNAPDPLAPPKRRGANPVVVVLLLALFACVVCTVIGVIGVGPQISAGIRQVQDVMLTVTANPDFATMIASGTSIASLSNSSQSQAGNGQALPSGLNNRGSLSYGQALQSTVDTFTDDSWTFTGTKGDRVTIEVDANNNALDSQIELYDTSRKQIAQNDDIDFNDNKNSRITIALPNTGTYTVVVSAFGSGGAYTLHLSRQS